MDPEAWRRGKRLLADALQLPPPAREAFVKSSCRDDVELATKLLSMLESRGSTGADPFEQSPVIDVDPLDDIQTGARVDRYTILDRIGRGGMGQVFLAVDPALRRKVALKCLLSTQAAGADRERIIQEAIAVAAINHPHVATIYHFVIEGGRAFIVMEYVPGETLAAKLRRGRMRIEDVLQIGRQLAAALGAAHGEGVIHRDIKPGNIQVTPGGSVKVLDFGVARTLESLASSTAGTTRGPHPRADQTVRAIWGTPPYMSPEQLAGRSVDARSDLYSLGVVLFEMATGRRPFDVTDELELLALLPEGAPRADAIERSVPRPVADVIAKALSVDTAARYQSAADLQRALEAAEQIAIRKPMGRRSFASLAARATAAILALLLTFTSLGLISTLIFNKALGRKGGFQLEPWSAMAVFGLRSLLGPVTLVVLAAIVFLAVVAPLFQLARSWQPIAQLVARVRAWPPVAAVEGKLRNPADLEYVVAVCGSIALVLLVFAYRSVIDAWTSEVDTAPRASLDLLSTVWPSVYRLRASTIVVALGFCLLYAIRRRLRDVQTAPRGGLYALCIVFAVAVVLNDLPYRLIRDNVQERVLFDAQRCYITGTAPEQLLLYCPDLPPPRNRAVARNDSRITRTGIRESIFAPAATASTAR